MKIKIPARLSSDSLPAIYRDPQRYLKTLPMRLVLTIVCVPFFAIASLIMAVVAVLVLPIACLFGEITFKDSP